MKIGLWLNWFLPSYTLLLHRLSKGTWMFEFRLRLREPKPGKSIPVGNRTPNIKVYIQSFPLPRVN